MRVTEKKKKLVETLAVKWKPQCHCDYLKKKKREREREHTGSLQLFIAPRVSEQARYLLLSFFFFGS